MAICRVCLLGAFTSGASLWAQGADGVALEWRSAITEVSVGDAIEIKLYAVSEDGTDHIVQAIDAIIQWDPLVLSFIEKLDDGAFTWDISTFPNDQGLDRLNADCGPDLFCNPFTELPFNDGEMLLQDFEVGTSFAVATVDGLFVGTLVFRALTDASLTEVVVVPTAGQVSSSRVLSGDELTPFANITGALGSIAVSVCPLPLPPPLQPQHEFIDFTGQPTRFRKNRYISFTAGEPARKQAIRVTLKSMPDRFSFAQGRTMWVGAPEMVSDVGGTVQVAEQPGVPSFAAAQLQCEPVFMDWHGVCGGDNRCVDGAKRGAQCVIDEDCLGVIHVFGKEIVPSTTSDLGAPDAVYEVQIVDVQCDADAAPPESSFSPGLELPTALWGDVVSDCSTTPCGPPDGNKGVALDVVAVLDKFPNRPGAPTKVRADLEPGILDHTITIRDITAALDAAGGLPYVFDGPTANGCPL